MSPRELENNKTITKFKDIVFDLSSVAKGYAVDLVYGWLKKSGFNNLFIEIGGEIRCSGFNKEGKNWVIGIDSPIEISSQRIFTTVQLQNASLATSGNYRNYLERDGKKISHTINPATGMPVFTNVLSVSVRSQNCLSADALSLIHISEPTRLRRIA